MHTVDTNIVTNGVWPTVACPPRRLCYRPAQICTTPPWRWRQQAST